METKRTRRSFSPEFKKQAVQRVLLLKEPAANVSAELEIKLETLSKWIKDYEKMV
uniref:transposase n=1 Tax=Turicimonas muris TaxID=1796652 RepID=UPI00402AF8F6